MASTPPSDGDEGRRLQRCIRDLAALNALPAMCIGRSPDEAFDLMLDALPTALSCELVYLDWPGTPPRSGANHRGARLGDEALGRLRAAVSAVAAAQEPMVVESLGNAWCSHAEVPVGSQRGTLLVARPSPFEPDTDRVLVRSAANLVGATLESARVLEAVTRKDDFLAMLGHELRNPLAPIVTAIELLSRELEPKRELEIINRNTKHLKRLVDDLLDISRVTRGYVELRDEDVALATILERAVDLAAPQMAEQGHTFKLHIGGDATVRGDAMRLTQVFGNLLLNATKFTPAGGHIDVRTTRTGSRVRVAVRDTGRGLEAEQRRRIFEPFVQIDRPRDALRGGLGLGLAIVHNLVERHGGTITVESEGSGKGSTFIVELPEAAPRQPPAAATSGPAPSARSARSGVRILVVDDNADVTDLLSLALEMEGFETAIAHDGHAALSLWDTFQPHAAILDVGLPEVDGFELAKRLRSKYGPTPTLIAATGYGRPTDRIKSADAGFDCHFVKPVSIEDLVRELDRRVVGRP